MGLYVLVGALSCSKEMGAAAVQALSLTRTGLMEAQVWRLVTYTFLTRDYVNLLFEVLVLFYIAAPLEAVWGTRRFLNLFLFSVVGGGLTAAFLNVPLTGGWAPMMTLMLIHGFLFPESVIYLFLVIPIRVKTLALISSAGFLVACVFKGFDGLALFAGLFCGVLYYVLATGHLPPIMKFKKKVRATVADPVNMAHGLSTAELLVRARAIMRRRDGGEPATDQDRLFIEELLKRAEPNEPLCSPYSFSPDNTICPPCKQFGHCLRRYIETPEPEPVKKIG